ncbi:MAG: RadC family protein [Crocinitomicaceae bacterium]|jgi:DNA repair protein RadC
MDTSFSIKNWALEDRPREKYVSKGVNSLTDAELFAILLGSGYKEKSALDLSKEMLLSVSNNLDAFARLTINDLIKFKGVGEVKAITLQVAFEIARRRKVAENSIEFIKTSEDVFKIFGPKLRDLSVEQFHIILLNRKNGILSMQKISEGGTTGTVVDAKVVFKKAFDHLATAMILVHNHPSGNKMPSSADLEITKKIKSFGELIEMTILDHIIIANDNYFSFADENVL